LDLGYLNRRGIIPESCIVQKGEGREKAFKEKKKLDSTSDLAQLASDDEEEEHLDVKDLAEMEG
jgi:tRNA pseudouridine38-40 synthase